MPFRFVAGLVVAALVSAAAVRARMLTAGGATAATLIGAMAVTAGWSWGILLVVFFVLASAVSAFRRDRKRAATRGIVAKAAARDAVQVASNGAVFAAASAAWLASTSPSWMAAAAGALAAAAADSWATEIGLAIGGPPRSVVSGKLLDRGLSGGITLAGSLGGAAGATATAVTVLIIGWPAPVAGAAILAGVAGMMIDSVLGATVQARRRCLSCGELTEQVTHHCGGETRVVSGTAFVTNDTVNALTTLAGAGLAVTLFRVLG